MTEGVEASEGRVFLRLVWNTEHFDPEGNLMGTAFTRSDLTGKIDKRDGVPSFCSVDDEAEINKASVDWRIAKQAASLPTIRIDPKFAVMKHEKLLLLKWIQSGQMLVAFPVPLQAGSEGPGSPANLAHWGFTGKNIDKLSKIENNGYVDYMRTRILEVIEEIRSYEEVFP